MPETMIAHNDIEAAARRLAIANVEAAPETEAIYLFPASDEIRLIETDPTTLPSREIAVFYFGPDPVGGIVIVPSGWASD